jgi:hypothetical protein
VSDAGARGPGSLTGPLYFIAFLLILIPIVDFAPNVWPPRPGEVGWRYGTVGLFANYLMTPVLGFALAMLIAVWAKHATLLRVSGWVVIVAAICLLGATLLFVLDAVQVRASVEAERQTLVVVGSGRAIFKNLVIAGGLMWLGLASLSVGVGLRERGGKSPKKPQAGILK